MLRFKLSMNAINYLKYPPIKSSLQKTLPEHLVYKFPSAKFFYTVQDCFVMFKTKQPQKKCFMRCYPSQIKRRDIESEIDSLYISNLISSHRRNGLGTKMLDFAQIYSKKIGCNGYFHLGAYAGYAPNSIPHIFYGKYGMNTESQKINKKIRNFIEKKKNATYNDIKDVMMYYPPIKFETWSDKIKNFFTSLIK